MESLNSAAKLLPVFTEHSRSWLFDFKKRILSFSTKVVNFLYDYVKRISIFSIKAASRLYDCIKRALIFWSKILLFIILFTFYDICLYQFEYLRWWASYATLLLYALLKALVDVEYRLWLFEFMAGFPDYLLRVILFVVFFIYPEDYLTEFGYLRGWAIYATIFFLTFFKATNEKGDLYAIPGILKFLVFIIFFYFNEVIFSRPGGFFKFYALLYLTLS